MEAHLWKRLSLLVISQIFHLWFCVWLSPSVDIISPVVTELRSDPHLIYLGVLRIIPLYERFNVLFIRVARFVDTCTV